MSTAKFGAELMDKLRGEDILDIGTVKPGDGWGGIIHYREELIDVSLIRFRELICILLCVKDVNKIVVFVQE